MIIVVADITDEAGELCPQCKEHLDQKIEEEGWWLAAVATAAFTGTTPIAAITQYTSLYHAYGHPTDEQIDEIQRQRDKRKSRAAAASCN